MFSTYAPESPYVIYCKDCWFSDAWNALDYGVDYDWNKSFFEQFEELKLRVPRVATMHVKMNTNSEYANFLGEAKNAYLAYSIVRSENIMYSRVVDDSLDCLDCLDVQHGELCYESIQSNNLNRTKHIYSCTDCISSEFLFDCVNCKDCFMSSNLHGKQHVFRNQQLSKEDYQKQIQQIDFGSYRQMQNLYREYIGMMGSSIHKYADMLKCTDCTGDNLMASKNTHVSFDVYDSENCKYSDRLIGLKDSHDIYAAALGELHYDGMAVTYGGSNTKFVLIGDDMRDSCYIDYCLHSSNLFGCISLKKSSYCILNKRYTKDEYEKLVPQIIEHMNTMPYTDPGGRVYRFGEFFQPYQYAYNETLAMEDEPLTKEQVLAKGYRWRDQDVRDYKITLPFGDLPDHIKDVDDSILNQIIACEHQGSCNEMCTTAFKITPQELQFYKHVVVPIPRLCPNCRHYARLKIRNPHKLWHRKCMHEGCTNEFETSYAPNRPETIYCEQCYQREVL